MEGLSPQVLNTMQVPIFKNEIDFERVRVKTYFIFQVNIVCDGQKGLNIQDQHSMLKNSCDEETKTSSWCLTLKES